MWNAPWLVVIAAVLGAIVAVVVVYMTRPDADDYEDDDDAKCTECKVPGVSKKYPCAHPSNALFCCKKTSDGSANTDKCKTNKLGESMLNRWKRDGTLQLPKEGRCGDRYAKCPRGWWGHLEEGSTPNEYSGKFAGGSKCCKTGSRVLYDPETKTSSCTGPWTDAPCAEPFN